MQTRPLLLLTVVVAGGHGFLLAAPADRSSTEGGGSSPYADVARLADGDLEAISVVPARVTVRGADRVVRIVVTGTFAGGGARDLTREAACVVVAPKVARVDEHQVVHPVSNGETTLRFEHSGKVVEVPVVVSHTESDLPINFANDIVPIFSKLGCNTGGCHGKSGGQNGFQMSLFGFTPSIDYRALRFESRGRRVFPAKPGHSLLLLKATGRLPHGGGAILDEDSPEHDLLARWIGSGLPLGRPDDPFVSSISVYPRHRAIRRGASQQLAVTALFSDGHTEDVTSVAEFSVSEEDYLEIDERGLVTARDIPGSGAVLVRFKGFVDSFRATIPSEVDISSFPWPEPRSYIDKLVFERLDALGIPPSKLSDDAAFVRRAFLAICGTLPRPAEVERFFADDRVDKRARLVDELLERPEYASYFALLWADVLRNRRGSIQAAPMTIRFRNWIHDQLLGEVSYDEFVRQIVCAEGSIADNPTVGWYRELDNPKKLVDDTAQVFLGTRMQCARCHHHPHEKWSQDDYWRFANFFSRVKRKDNSTQRTFAVTLERRRSRLNDDESTSATYRKSYKRLQAPGGPEIEEDLNDDPRQLLVDWMVAADNRLLAKALVNRYWKTFFGRGIVEPEDDIRATNPASNPELLDALAKDFSDSGYDLKHLVRRIINSATFQLSSEPNEHNKTDRQNFSRFQARRLPAEVVLDAVDQVLGTTTRFDGMRRGARAIEIPDEGSRNYFLDTFGKPQRATACACERAGSVTLPQVILFLNSRQMSEKIADKAAPPARFVADERPDAEKVRELFLRVFSRPPRAEESERALSYLKAAAAEKKNDKAAREAWEDLVWALLNSKEFVFLR